MFLRSEWIFPLRQTLASLPGLQPAVRCRCRWPNPRIGVFRGLPHCVAGERSLCSICPGAWAYDCDSLLPKFVTLRNGCHDTCIYQHQTERSTAKLYKKPPPDVSISGGYIYSIDCSGDSIFTNWAEPMSLFDLVGWMYGSWERLRFQRLLVS